jgi:hypothetical protein
MNRYKRNKFNIISYKEQLEAVKENGCLIQYINKPSLELQLEAIKQNAFSIWYISVPSFYVVLFAYLQNDVQGNETPELRKYIISLMENRLAQGVKFLV